MSQLDRVMGRREFLGYALASAGVCALAGGLRAAEIAAQQPSEEAKKGKKFVIGHRGACAYAPENTLPSYRLAMQQGADFVEQDLQITRDGVLLCSHDETLERVTNVTEIFPDRFTEEAVKGKKVKRWHIHDFTLKEIRQLDAGAKFATRFKGTTIPTWQEAIDEIKGKAGLCPEIKNPEVYSKLGLSMEQLVIEMLRKNGLEKPTSSTPILIQSFSKAAVRKSGLGKLAGFRRVRFNDGMNQPKQRRCGGLPYNPGVRDMVEGKRRWSTFLKTDAAKEGFRGWHERGYLPHRDEPGLTQFVTFRLADSFPEPLRSEWEHLWKIENDRQRRIELEAYLDTGRGACHLRRAEIAELVENALHLFHRVRYELRAWVIMSNHVHALFKVDAVPMAEIIESWKKHTASKANRLLGRRGAFWAADYFDTFMRDAEHERKTVRYIENNPTKAKLVLDPRDWTWTSAKHRDACGRLCL